MTSTLTVTPVTAAIGGVVEGVDLRDPNLDLRPVLQALWQHEVLFFRGVHLTPEEHLALGRRFGTPSIFPVARLLGSTEPTLTVIEDGPDSPNVADEWHTDVTWIETPPAYALLCMDVIPAAGGDTLWGSATAAYRALSPRMQDFLAGLTAVHDNEGFIAGLIKKVDDPEHELVAQLRRAYPPVRHPLVRTHPETGQRAIMYASRFLRRIEDLTESESRAVIDFLGDHMKNPSFHCRWRWEPGDLAVWDERSTVHRAAADHFPQRRRLRRLEIDGDRPFFDPTR